MQSSDLNTFQFKNLLSDDAMAGGGGRGDNNQGEELDEFRFGSSNTILRAMFHEILPDHLYCELID